MIRLPNLLLLLAAIACCLPHSAPAQQPPQDKPAFHVQLDTPLKALDPHFCWFHPRAAAIPGAGRDGQPAVLITLQKHLKVSDYYSGLWTMRTDDLGKTWTGPTEIPELAWRPEPNGVVLAVADVTPGYHAPTGKLLAIGCSVRYSPKGAQLADTKRFSQTAYAVYDAHTNRWTKWQTLQLPSDDKFNMARCACAQWIVDSDGTLLVAHLLRARRRCACFGDRCPRQVRRPEAHLPRARRRALAQRRPRPLRAVNRQMPGPLLAHYPQRSQRLRHRRQGRPPLRPRSNPGRSTTAPSSAATTPQQHWLAHGDGLFLCYTRRGANNDHIPRNRATPVHGTSRSPETLRPARHRASPRTRARRHAGQLRRPPPSAPPSLLGNPCPNS